MRRVIGSIGGALKQVRTHRRQQPLQPRIANRRQLQHREQHRVVGNGRQPRRAEQFIGWRQPRPHGSGPRHGLAQRGIDLEHGRKDVGEILRQFGDQFQGPGKACRGLLEPALSHQQDAKILVRLGELRLERDRFAERNGSRLRMPGRRQRIAQAVVTNGDFGTSLCSLAEMLHRLTD